MVSKLIKVKNNRRGVLLFGVIVLIAILGIMYFKGFTLFSTDTRRYREEDLNAKLEQIRKALDNAKKNPNFVKDTAFDTLDENTDSKTVREKVISALANKNFTRTYLETNSVYLRQEFEAPMLDVDTAGKWNVGWRIAVNRVNSSSFEGDNFRRIYKIIDQSNVAEVNQWWFATTTENSIISVVPDADKPLDSDYPGQRDTLGNKGKYGKNVLRMTVK